MGQSTAASRRPLKATQLYEHLRERLGISWSQARAYVKELERLAIRELRAGREFEIPGIVLLTLTRRKARAGRNPATGEMIRIPPAAALKGRIAPKLRDAIAPVPDTWVVTRRDSRVRSGRKEAAKGGLGRMGFRSPSRSAKKKPVGAGSELEVVRVHFGTDRKPHGSREGFFTDGRSEKLHFGWCDVSIPPKHKVAAVERPSIWKLQLFENPDKHLVIVKRATLSARQFWGEIGASSATDALVFVHGYNVGFDAAVYRTAQISHDLRFEGITALYSWASCGSTLKYAIDGSNCTNTVIPLRQFICDLANKSGVARLHLIAHSMGNRALTEALHQVAISGRALRGKIVNVILTAPDIDADAFRKMAQEMSHAAGMTTLYASSRDKALRASMRLHKYPRAGDARQIVVVKGIDTVDASSVKTDFLGHSYYGDRRSVLSDIYDIVKHGFRPKDRFNLRGVPTESPKHWEFRPAN